MMKTFLALAAAALLAGCASPAIDDAPASSQQPMPDGRELSEHPLDVLDLPQP